MTAIAISSRRPRVTACLPALTLALTLTGCTEGAGPVGVWAKVLNAVGMPLGAVEAVERHNAAAAAAARIPSLTVSVRPGSLSVDDAQALQAKLRRYGANPEVVGVLAFANHYKKREHDLAERALRAVNKEVAKQIVATVRETQKQERDRAALLPRIGADEAEEFEEELEFISRMTDCQRDIYTGAFGGMGETLREKMQFCLLWDSGLLDLIPSPVKAAKAASSVARVGGKAALMRMTRQELMQLPRFAAISGKYTARRSAAHEAVKQAQEREKRLVDALLDLQWDIVVEFASAGRS